MSRFQVVAVGLVAVALAGCGQSPAEGQSEEAAKKIEEGAKAMQQGADQMAQSAQQNSTQMAAGLQQMAEGFKQMAQGSAKAVDYEVLKGVMPAVPGWERGEVKGEQLTMPVSQSRAETSYRKDASRIELEVTDTALNPLLLAPISMFLASGYSERSDEGFKHAVKVAGLPGYEEWTAGSKHGEVTAVVNNRFIVHATGHDVDAIDPVRSVVEAVNLAKLAAIK
jgi:X-X-X-Leu-X-X-Gly heptad repeat protein